MNCRKEFQKCLFFPRISSKNEENISNTKTSSAQLKKNYILIRVSLNAVLARSYFIVRLAPYALYLYRILTRSHNHPNKNQHLDKNNYKKNSSKIMAAVSNWVFPPFFFDLMFTRKGGTIEGLG